MLNAKYIALKNYLIESGETKQRIRQRTERLYYMKQKLSGAIMAAIGIIIPFLLDGDATVSLLLLPLGTFLLLTKEKVMTF